MALFTTYLDASGTAKTPVLTVAGFVAHVKRWERFDRKWRDILERQNITSFHMTEFVSNQGEFREWRGQSERRRAFIADLVECIKQETKRGFTASVIMSDYEEVNQEYELREYAGTPYALCAVRCLAGLNRWLAKRNLTPSETLVVVERGDQDLGSFLDKAEQYGYKAISLPKQDAQPFQAADLVGWKCRTMVTNALSALSAPLTNIGDAENIMHSLDPIRAIIQDNGAHDKSSLLVFCANAQIPQRRGRIRA